MKLAYQNSWLRIFTPSKRIGWIGLMFFAGAFWCVVTGELQTAWDMLQTALLCEVLDRLPMEK